MGRVAHGPCAYIGWDNVHYPLFSVGGATPPTHISVSVLHNASALWSYSPGWTSGSPSIPIDFTVVYLVVCGISAVDSSDNAGVASKKEKVINAQSRTSDGKMVSTLCVK